MAATAWERWGGLLWIPYTYLLIALVDVIVIVVLTVSGVRWDPDDRSPFVWALAVVPAITAVALAIAGVIVARVRREPSGATILWTLTLPARGWSLLWWIVLRYLFARFLVVALAMVAVTFPGFVLGALISMDAATWIIVVFAVLGLGLVVGGTRWANGYSSGITGGFPVGLFVACCVGIGGWLLLVVVTVALFLLPFTMPLLIAVVIEAPLAPEAWVNWLVALLLAVPFLALPLTLDLRTR